MYSKTFEIAIDHLMLYEVGGKWNINNPGVLDGTNAKNCGYTKDISDHGGETKYGISKQANPDVNIVSLTWEKAKDLYYTRYWIPAKCDILPDRIAALTFDSAVNHGVRKSAIFIQKALGTIPDGIIGEITLKLITTAKELIVCNSICDQRIAVYLAIISNDPSQEKFKNGWIRRVEEMRKYVIDQNTKF